MRSSGTHVSRHTRKDKRERVGAPPERAESVQRLSPRVGHTRLPALAREPTALESIASKLTSQLQRSSFATGLSGSRISGGQVKVDNSAIASDDDEVPEQTKENDMDEAITWAGWDELDGKRLLVLAYRLGLQIWDATSLDTLHEITNIKDSSLGSVKFATVLPAPSKGGHDHYADARPLLALLTVPEGQSETEFMVYSLATRSAVLNISFPRAGVISANESFVVISSAQPPTLHILSSHTLSLAYTLIQPTDASQSNPSFVPAAQPTSPPIFALSKRLIAFSSLPPSAHSLRQGFKSTVGYGSSQKHVQIEVANTARRVGEGVWGGMKVLSGMAFGTAAEGSVFSKSAPAAAAVSFGGWFDTSSAAAAPPRHSERRSSSNDTTKPYIRSSSSSDNALGLGWISILDLKPILSSYPPAQVTHFSFNSSPATKGSKPITALSFSPNGNFLAAADTDGTVVKIFQPRPTPRLTEGLASSLPMLGGTSRPPHVRDKDGSARRRGSDLSGSEDQTGRELWHVYDLVRGVTRARVESIEWSRDMRWVAVGTAKGTLHLFAINPYGGRPDEDSHLEGRVRNVLELQPLSTTVTPTSRFHLPKSNQPSLTPPVFALLPLSVALNSETLIPRSDPSTPTSAQFKRNSMSLSPPPGPAMSFAFQDVLILDPANGKLALRRCTVKPSSSSPSSTPVPPRGSPQKTSTSLPASSPSRVSGLTSMMRAVAGAAGGATGSEEGAIAGVDSLVATWDVRREKGWDEVLPRFGGHLVNERRRVSRVEWLAQAELSTASRSTSMLPAPIYLSHQFTFFSLHDDWHALIRRSRFELPASKLEVRKEVKVSAYSGGNSQSGSFIQGEPREGGGNGRSFDKPIASAIHASLETSGSPTIIPSFPNAYKADRTWVATIPIRSVAVGLTDGVNEGFGRLKREMVKIGSPKKPTMKLHFDEHEAVFAEEEYAGPSEAGDGERDEGGSSGGSNSGPSTVPAEPEEPWEAYSEDEAYTQAVREDARFEDVGVMGMMDEEQEARRAHARAAMFAQKKEVGK